MAKPLPKTVVLYHGQVDENGWVTATFAWPPEWGPMSIPRVVEMAPLDHSPETESFINGFLAAAHATADKGAE